MSKYEALGPFLKAQHVRELPMSFSEIEAITGTKLPPSAYKHRPWWSNNPNNSVMTKVWLDAGFRTEQVDMAGERLVFVRSSEPGSEVPPASNPARSYAIGNPPRHPAIGAMKGTVTVEPGIDLTQPVLEADWEAEFDARWDALGFPKR